MTRNQDAHESQIGPQTAPGANHEALLSELLRIVRRAEVRAEDERRIAGRWNGIYMIVGLPAAVLAAVAGATALISTAGRVPAGIIALVSSALGATATFFDSSTRKVRHENLAAGWQLLANDAHVRVAIDLQNSSWARLHGRSDLQELLDRERKLLQGQAPDAEAEAERRAQVEAIRAQAEAARAEAEAERATAAEARARAEARDAEAGRALARVIHTKTSDRSLDNQD